MPKRRMTPARRDQIARWREAGVAARRNANPVKDTVPMGKHVIGFHHTSKAGAQGIRANGFHKSDFEKWIWFSNRRGQQASNYLSKGNDSGAVVKIRVPRGAIRVTNQKGNGEYYFGVDPKYLAAKFKRHQANQRRKAKGMSPIRTPIRAGIGDPRKTIRIASLGSRRIR